MSLDRADDLTYPERCPLWSHTGKKKRRREDAREAGMTPLSLQDPRRYHRDTGHYRLIVMEHIPNRSPAGIRKAAELRL